MAGVSHHSWDLETEVPTVLTRATVADGKYIQKDTIDPLINRDEALKSWLEDTGDELIRVSGELMDTISSVSSTLDTKIDTTSAALHNEITATSASLHEELTAASASLDAKIDTASGNIMSAMKTSADSLIQYTNAASAYVQGNLQTSADTLVSALNDLDNEFTTYLKTLCSAGEVGQVAVWENVSEGTYALSARPIVASPDNTNGFVESSGIKSYVDTQINEHVAGLFSFKGSKSVDEINALNTMSAGDVYNLNTNGIISAGEFGNMSAQSGDNIVYVTNDGAPHWDKMAAAFNDENCMKLVSSATSGNIATFNSKGQVEDLGIDPANFGKCEVIQIEGSIGNPSFWSDDMTTTYYNKVLNAAKDALQNGKSLIIDVGSNREGSQCYYDRFELGESNINDGSSSGWFEFKYIGDGFEVGTSETDATDNSGFRIYYGSSYEDKCKLIEKKPCCIDIIFRVPGGTPQFESEYIKEKLITSKVIAKIYSSIASFGKVPIFLHVIEQYNTPSNDCYRAINTTYGRGSSTIIFECISGRGHYDAHNLSKCLQFGFNGFDVNDPTTWQDGFAVKEIDKSIPKLSQLENGKYISINGRNTNTKYHDVTVIDDSRLDTVLEHKVDKSTLEAELLKVNHVLNTKLENIEHDSSLIGNGTVDQPLGHAIIADGKGLINNYGGHLYFNLPTYNYAHPQLFAQSVTNDCFGHISKLNNSWAGVAGVNYKGWANSTEGEWIPLFYGVIGKRSSMKFYAEFTARSLAPGYTTTYSLESTGAAAGNDASKWMVYQMNNKNHPVFSEFLVTQTNASFGTQSFGMWGKLNDAISALGGCLEFGEHIGEYNQMEKRTNDSNYYTYMTLSMDDDRYTEELLPWQRNEIITRLRDEGQTYITDVTREFERKSKLSPVFIDDI